MSDSIILYADPQIASDLEDLPTGVEKARKGNFLVRLCFRERVELQLEEVKEKLNKAKEDFRVSIKCE
jgi:hypothetical protein